MASADASLAQPGTPTSLSRRVIPLRFRRPKKTQNFTTFHNDSTTLEVSNRLRSKTRQCRAHKPAQEEGKKELVWYSERHHPQPQHLMWSPATLPTPLLLSYVGGARRYTWLRGTSQRHRQLARSSSCPRASTLRRVPATEGQIPHGWELQGEIGGKHEPPSISSDTRVA